MNDDGEREGGVRWWERGNLLRMLGIFCRLKSEGKNVKKMVKGKR